MSWNFCAYIFDRFLTANGCLFPYLLLLSWQTGFPPCACVCRFTGVSRASFTAFTCMRKWDDFFPRQFPESVQCSAAPSKLLVSRPDLRILLADHRWPFLVSTTRAPSWRQDQHIAVSSSYNGLDVQYRGLYPKELLSTVGVTSAGVRSPTSVSKTGLFASPVSRILDAGLIVRYQSPTNKKIKFISVILV